MLARAENKSHLANEIGTVKILINVSINNEFHLVSEKRLNVVEKRLRNYLKISTISFNR